MMNERGERVKSAGPSVPVEVTGLNEVPVGGDTFNAVSDERLARELVEQRLTEQKEEMFNSQTKVTLDNLFEQMKEGEMKELKVIVKADVQGSVEAVRQSLEKLSNDEVRVHVIHGAVGAISESDVHVGKRLERHHRRLQCPPGPGRGRERKARRCRYAPLPYYL